MEETNFDRLITIWSIITAIGVIISGIGVYYFRHYTAKKNSQSFLAASEHRDKIEKDLNELSYPFPSELIPIDMEIVLHSDGFNELLPELLEIAKIDSSKFDKGRKYGSSTTGLGYGFVSNDVMKTFDGKSITLIVDGTDDGPMNAGTKGFVWQFKTDILLREKQEHHLSFRVNYSSEEPYELFLRLRISDKSEQLGTIRVFKGISSALELCDRKVWIHIYLDDTGVKIPVYTIKSLSFRDNHSNDYKVDIEGTETYQRKMDYSKLLESTDDPMIKSSISRLPSIDERTFMIGQIKCLSF